MLVLTLHVGHSLQIGRATVILDRIDYGKVRLAIDAPPEVRILRDDAKDKTPKHALKGQDAQGA